MKRRGDKTLDRTLAAGALLTETEAKRSIQAHESKGNQYKRGTVTHTASTPGNPPNSDTGNLVNNITVEKINGGYDVGSRRGAPYGLWLEFGTASVQARPWLAPAYAMAIDRTIQKLKEADLL